MPTMELHYRVAVLIGIVNDRDRLLPDGVASAVDLGDQDEPTRDTLPLNHAEAVMPVDPVTGESDAAPQFMFGFVSPVSLRLSTKNTWCGRGI